MVVSPLPLIQSWWRYVDNCCRRRRTPSGETFTGPVLAPGTRLRATDRSYEVTRSGAWIRLPGKESRPARKSQIRALRKKPHNKY